jgi:hypothetical protein
VTTSSGDKTGVTAPISIGDRVAYSREFLRNTAQHTGWAPFARGEVTGFVELSKGYILVEVRWDDGTGSNVLPVNLVREDRIPFEPV